jgi:peptidoglycan/xylan/chitin deacetylase (PgdA/CDA1 family)
MAEPEIASDAGIENVGHLLTFDIEDWHRGLPATPNDMDGHLEAAMETVLDALQAMHVSATFFVLGEDAHRIRTALRRSVSEGHEVASHGMRHARADSLSRQALRQDIADSFALLQDIVQRPCRGYRAPWFSLTPDMTWCFEFLAEQGALYDASLRLPLGTPPPPVCRQLGLAEVAVPLLRYGRREIGILGGLLFRILPKPVIRRLLTRCAQAGKPGCLYLHPYEWLSSGQHPNGPLMSTIRRRLLVSQTLSRLHWATKNLQFMSIENWLQKEGPA